MCQRVVSPRLPDVPLNPYSCVAAALPAAEPRPLGMRPALAEQWWAERCCGPWDVSDGEICHLLTLFQFSENWSEGNFNERNIMKLNSTPQDGTCACVANFTGTSCNIPATAITNMNVQSVSVPGRSWRYFYVDIPPLSSNGVIVP